MNRSLPLALNVSFVAGLAPAQISSPAEPGTIWVSTDAAQIVVYEAKAPWTLLDTIQAPGNRTIIRETHESVLLFDLDSGALQRISKKGIFDTATVVVPGAPFADIRPLPDGSLALTRPGDSRVWRYTPGAFALTLLADLMPLSPQTGIEARSMAVSGKRLYVQAQPGEPAGAIPSAEGPPRGLLAVVAHASGVLIDTDPLMPGTQAVTLTGSGPTGEMMLSTRSHRLTVSAPTDQFDFTGAIDVIDLGTNRVVATPVNERGPNSYGHLGGFAHDQLGNGMFVFHTDLATSSHLQWFSVAGGPATGPAYLDLLESGSDIFESQPHGSIVYFVQGGIVPGEQGVHIFNVATRTTLLASPLPIPGNPIDIEHVE